MMMKLVTFNWVPVMYQALFSALYLLSKEQKGPTC